MKRQIVRRCLHGIWLLPLIGLFWLRPAPGGASGRLALTPVAWLPLQAYHRATPTPTPTASRTPAPSQTPTRTATPTHTPTVTPTPLPELSIRALMPAGRDEYVEIYNAGPGPQSLYGWKIRSVVGEQWYTFPWGIALAAGDWVQVHSGPDAVDAPPRYLKWGAAYIWNDRSDQAELIDDKGIVVDRWAY